MGITYTGLEKGKEGPVKRAENRRFDVRIRAIHYLLKRTFSEMAAEENERRKRNGGKKSYKGWIGSVLEKLPKGEPIG